MDAHPVRLVVEDDLERNRLTVFFRLILAIPHIVWLILWTVAAWIVSPPQRERQPLPFGAGSWPSSPIICFR